MYLPQVILKSAYHQQKAQSHVRNPDGTKPPSHKRPRPTAHHDQQHLHQHQQQQPGTALPPPPPLSQEVDLNQELLEYAMDTSLHQAGRGQTLAKYRLMNACKQVGAATRWCVRRSTWLATNRLGLQQVWLATNRLVRLQGGVHMGGTAQEQ